MAIRREEAFVLKRVPLRETSISATLLTRGAGKIRVLAKGVRGEKKPLAGRFEPFTRLAVVYYEKLRSELHLVSDAAVLDPNSFVRNRLDVFGYASYMVELIDSLFGVSDPQPGVFDLFGASLRLFQSGPARHVMRVFEVKVLEKAGLVPSVEHCLVCKNKVEGRAFFSPKQGGLMCSDCERRELGAIPISQGTIRTLLFYLHSELSEAVELGLNRQIERELERILGRFLQFRLDYPLRSTLFLAEIKPILRLAT